MLCVSRVSGSEISFPTLAGLLSTRPFREETVSLLLKQGHPGVMISGICFQPRQLIRSQ